MAGAPDAHTFIDIAPVIERKKAALRRHTSQFSAGFLQFVEMIAGETAT